MGRAWILIDDDRALLWSTVVDAPVSYLTLLDELDPDVAEQLRDKGHTWSGRARCDLDELVGFNRAGPGQTCLTVDALRRCFVDATACETFELTPDDIAPYTCHAVDGHVYWVPWAPGDAPDSLDGLTLADLRANGPRVDSGDVPPRPTT